jgi:hypothetical protein
MAAGPTVELGKPSSLCVLEVMMESLVTYLVAAMVAWVPLYVHPQTESSADVRARYESIARDLSAVVLDDAEAPLFNGPDARAQTALLMLSIASFESAFRKVVDDGVVRGDGGRSYCLMQIRVGQEVTREGWTGRQLIENRKRCFRAALHMLRTSFNMCHSYPVEDRVSVYATGHCMLDAPISRSRVVRARHWWAMHALPRLAPAGAEVVRAQPAPADGRSPTTPTGS